MKAATRPDTTRDASPIDLLISTVRSGDDPLTEHGAQSLREDLQLARTFLPEIVPTGLWKEFYDGPVAAAIQAIIDRHTEPNDWPQDATCNREHATYYVGVAVGMALASQRNH